MSFFDSFKMDAKKAPTGKPEEYNAALLYAIQPHGNLRLNDERYIKIGDGFCSCIQLYGFPEQVYDFWLTKLMNLDNVITMLDVGSTDPYEVQKKIGHSLNELDSRFAGAKNDVGRIEAQKKYDALHSMLVDIHTGGEMIKNIFLRIYVSGRTRGEVDVSVQKIVKELEAQNYNASVFLNETEYQYKALFAPYTAQTQWRNKRVGTPLPAFSLAGGYPFHYEQLNDPCGMYLAHSETGGNIIFDLFEKTKQRLSYDALIIGKKGSGKSTLLKLLMTNNAIIGNYVRAIDVTGEFTDLAHALGGTVVSLDGKHGLINYLEVFKTSPDESTCFAAHLSKLNTFFKFISPSSTEDVANQFEICVRKLYTKKGLWDEEKAANGETQRITGLAPQMYPTFSELFDLIQSELYIDVREKILNPNLSPSQSERLEKIELTLETVVKSYGKMFDGHTSIPQLGDQQVVIFNLQNITNMKEELVNAMLFNVLSLMLDDMIRIGLPSKEKFDKGVPIPDIPKLLLVIDEAHKILSTKNPLALDHMLSIVREGRKYFTGLAFASQSLRDYAPENSDSAATDELKKLFEMLQYKFIMQQDSNALSLMRSVFEGEFTESQMQMIPKFRQGESLLSIGGTSYHIAVEVSDKELELFKGGA